ncbi:hypothetical protein LCGC14_0319760 [marine sediment metagenome]|uniref:Uncharacterized protein n=1 Tax=marine sediment metagenome TaxID=412755 RepID=A0A0F9WRI7_9ZZZZ
MGVEMEDATGKPSTIEDIERAATVVRKSIITAMMKLPPELAIELTTILRCLDEYRAIRVKLEQESGG